MHSPSNAVVALEPKHKPETSIEPSGLACLVIVARHHGMHLSVSQLIHDHVLSKQEVSVDEIVKCAKSSGLAAKVVDLDWDGSWPTEENPCRRSCACATAPAWSCCASTSEDDAPHVGAAGSERRRRCAFDPRPRAL